MVKIYVKKITSGTMLWTDVPSLWQSKVIAELEKEYILNEDGTVTPKPINEPIDEVAEE